MLAAVGCDILDIKEPSHGALGAADETVWRAVSQLEALQSTPLSVALGELAHLESVPLLPDGIAYCKLGLAGMAAAADWRARWLAARDAISERAESMPSWVAVSYADHVAAVAPEPLEIAQAAVAHGCRVFLVDTFMKLPGRCLFDELSVRELHELGAICRDGGVEFAIAGQLRLRHAGQIAAAGPDIVGIRGAACRARERGAEIDAAAAFDFREALRHAVPSRP